MDPAVARRTAVLAQHLLQVQSAFHGAGVLESTPCLQYVPPEAKSSSAFDPAVLRQLLDGDGVEALDDIFEVLKNNKIFWPKHYSGNGQLYTSMDYNSTKEEQREITMKRILFLRDHGYFRGWLTDDSLENLKQKGAMHEALGIYDHSITIKIGVHIHLWGGAVKYLGTKRHHDKWLKRTEDYDVIGCFALTELGHGSNVRGIETVATYDASTEEFVINTPCESAQKYWIGGAADHANHTVAFAQLHIGGRNEGVHAFIVPIRTAQGLACPGVRIADCGHKIGLNGVDNGRIWFDSVRIPRENILNAVADVSADGTYQSVIIDPDQRFGAFMAPLTGGRVTIASGAACQSRIGLAIAIRYGLTRRAFSVAPDQEEELIINYPSHQRRLFPLLAKTYAVSFAVNGLKALYLRRTPADSKVIHVQSSGYKALSSWHMLRTLQECREACGGMGIRSDNRIGQLKAEHDVMATFEGDNNVLMQQVSKALLGDYMTANRKGKPLRGMGMEHVNGPSPVLPREFTRDVLRDGDFLLTLFRLRERDLLERFAARIVQLQSRGVSMADAFNESYQLAGDLGTAHAEREVLEAIHGVVHLGSSGHLDRSLKEVLVLLQSLFALSTVDEDAVFLRYGYVTPHQAQAIHAEVVALCAAMRPHALGLVEALGLPPHLLGPIAHDWVENNAWKNVRPATNYSWTSETLQL